MNQEELNSKVLKAFDEDFCVWLEYHIIRTFNNTADKTISRLWCDGIEVPALNYQPFDLL